VINLKYFIMSMSLSKSGSSASSIISGSIGMVYLHIALYYTVTCLA
jgi:hypothetical protein